MRPPPRADAQPQAAHRFCAWLHRQGWLRRVYTQNVDGLHRKAGSNPIEIHGTVDRLLCTTSFTPSVDLGPLMSYPGGSYTEVEYHRGRKPSMSGSLIGSVVGLFLLAGATALLWTNEGSAVAAQYGLLEAERHHAAGTGGVAHLSGELRGRGDGMLRDDAFDEETCRACQGRHAPAGARRGRFRELPRALRARMAGAPSACRWRFAIRVFPDSSLEQKGFR